MTNTPLELLQGLYDRKQESIRKSQQSMKELEAKSELLKIKLEETALALQRRETALAELARILGSAAYYLDKPSTNIMDMKITDSLLEDLVTEARKIYYNR